MASLLSDNDLKLYYLSIKDKDFLNEVLRLENQDRIAQKLPLLTISDLEKKDIVVSLNNNRINGYSLTNYTINSNNDVTVFIEKLNELDPNDLHLHNALFESALFVAVQKSNLNSQNIIKSSLFVKGKEITFNINSEYIKRNLDSKFNKDAVKQKVEQDKNYIEERNKKKNELEANTFYNETGHRFHSNVDENGNLSVVNNDFGVLTLDEELKYLQTNNVGKDITLNQAYDEFAEQKIDAKLLDSLTIDEDKLTKDQKDVIGSATMASNTPIKVDVENQIAFDKDSNKIYLNENKESLDNISRLIENLSSKNFSTEQIKSELSKNSIWNGLSKDQQNKIIEVYDLSTTTETNQTNELTNNNSKVLVLKKDQAAYISSSILIFASGLVSGVVITLLIMFLKTRLGG